MKLVAFKTWMLAGVITATAVAPLRAGSIVRLFYDGITGSTVADLTARSVYPDGSDDAEVRTDFFEGSIGANGVDNFGSLMRGWITAPQTGQYVFWINADDTGELWLSPDASVANKRKIAIEPGPANSRDYDGLAHRNPLAPENNSSTFLNNADWGPPWSPFTIILTQGQQYYVEVIHKESLGGDNVSVGWQLPDGTLERPIRGIHLMDYNPPGTPPYIDQNFGQPKDVNVFENQPASFWVTYHAVPPVTFQWYRNGAPIPGASLPFYTLAKTALADSNAKFKVKITSGGKTITSEEHNLKVNVDTNPPVLVAVSTRGNPNAVQVQYSEPVDDTTATSLANYAINGGITITNVVKATNAANAVVYQLNTREAMSEGRPYTLAVNNVKDLAAAGNTIAAGTLLQFYLLTGSITRNFYDIPSGGSITALTNSAAFLNNQPISQSSASAIGWASTMSIGVSGRTTVAGADFSYGSELIGYLIPPLSGLYTFFLATDDNGRLFLSTDSNPANNQLIAQELTWNNRRNWTGAHGGIATVADTATGRLINVSVPIQLTAGARYFIQSLQAENSSGDNHEVGWQLPSDSGPPVNGSVSGDVQGYALSSYNTLGPVVLTNFVGGDQRVTELGTATWRVRADGSAPFSFRWQRAPFDNPTAFLDLGQIGYDLRLDPVQLTDAGIYRVIVSNWFSSATSSPVTLTVIQDLTKPAFAIPAPTADSTYHRIIVGFSEAVTTRSQTNLANYALTGGLTLTNLIRVSATKSILEVSPKLTPGTEYTLTVRDLQDMSAAANTMDATNVSVFGWVMSRGVAAMHVYNGPTNRVALLSDAKFRANNPDDVGVLTSFNSRDYYPDDSHDNYGSSNWALLYPPITGDYRFFVTGDDRAELYLSSDNDPANASHIASAYTVRGPDPIVPFTPTIIKLTSGQAYFMYILAVESSGPDYSAAYWRIPGEDLNDTTGLTPIPGIYLAAPAPTQNASVTVTQQPVDMTLEASQTVTFRGGASANSAFSTVANYQWQRANPGATLFTDIPTAISNSFTIQYPKLEDHGAQFRFIASIANVSATSQVARLSVTADSQSPRLIAAVSTDGTSVTLIFNEPMGPGGTYAVHPGVTMNSASPRGTAPQLIDLKTSSLTPGNIFTVVGIDIPDLAGNRTSFVVTVLAQTYSGNPARLIPLTTQGMLSRGSLAENLRGFELNQNFVSTNQSVIASNTLAQTELQFQGLQGANLLPAAARYFTIRGVVNWDGGPASQGRVPNDTQFPDLLAAGLANLNNHAIEIRCYVDLAQGIHRWGVNSDDGFRLANNPTFSFADPDQVVLGQFEGTRTAGDTRFDFVVPQDGLYPFRLIYQQGGGTSNLEWWEKPIEQEDPASGPWLLINGTDGGPKTYFPPIHGDPPPPPFLFLTRTGGSLTLTWANIGQTVLESCGSLATNSIWIPVPATNGNYTATFSSTNQFFRLRR